MAHSVYSPHYILQCRNPPTQEEDAKSALQGLSVHHDIHSILLCVSTLHGKSERYNKKTLRLIKKYYFSFQLKIIFLEVMFIIFDIQDVFTLDASGLVRFKIFSKYSAASRCSNTEVYREEIKIHFFKYSIIKGVIRYSLAYCMSTLYVQIDKYQHIILRF